MALQLSRTTRYGTDAAYWRLTSITHRMSVNIEVNATMAGYLSGDSRADRLMPLATIGVRVYKDGYMWKLDIGDLTYTLPEKFELPNDITRTWLYGLVKQTADWRAANNV